jgi:hypothetical protein
MALNDKRCEERGIALILALMALLVLTAIGLTLATITASETQAAVNYRWSRKAFYNAEAGIAVGRVVLSDLSWTYALPPARGPWEPDASPAGRPLVDEKPAAFATSTTAPAGRDYEMAACDKRGNGTGYGVVLFDGNTTYQDVSEVYGHTLDGAFTLWVRRPLSYEPDGKTRDYPFDDVLILVSEGVAPAVNPNLALSQAREVIEVTLYSSYQGVTVGPPPLSILQPAVSATTTPFKVGSSACR